MDFKIVCGTWIKEDDEKILTVLQKMDHWPTPEELSEMTGLPQSKVHSTLAQLNRQKKLADMRRALTEE